MKHFDKHGPLHFNEKHPSLAPLVFKLGDKADDDRFRALGLSPANTDPDRDTRKINFVAFDRKGEFITFHYNAFHQYSGLFNTPTASIIPTANSRLDHDTGTVYISVFTPTQVAEFLILADGALVPNDIGRPNSAFEFPQRVPLSIVSTHNPYSEKIEDTLYLHELPPMSTSARVIDRHFLGGIRGLYPEFSQLEADACFQALLEGILSIIIEQETITAKERKEIITKLIVDRKVLRGVIPDAVKTIHTLAQIHDAAGSSRRVILREVYETTPSHIHHKENSSSE